MKLTVGGSLSRQKCSIPHVHSAEKSLWVVKRALTRQKISVLLSSKEEVRLGSRPKLIWHTLWVRFWRGEIWLRMNVIIASSLRNPSFFSSANLLLTWLARAVGFLETSSQNSGSGGPGV